MKDLTRCRDPIAPLPVGDCFLAPIEYVCAMPCVLVGRRLIA